MERGECCRTGMSETSRGRHTPLCPLNFLNGSRHPFYGNGYDPSRRHGHGGRTGKMFQIITRICGSKVT